jgi:hypothetical protein
MWKSVIANKLIHHVSIDFAKNIITVHKKDLQILKKHSLQ